MGGSKRHRERDPIPREVISRAKMLAADGLNLSQIADACGVSRYTVRRWRDLEMLKLKEPKPEGPVRFPSDETCVVRVRGRTYGPHNVPM